MNTYSKVIIAVIVIAVIAFTAYRYSKDGGQSASGEPIKIGAILSQSGVAAAFGEVALKAANLAVDEINAKGGINGRQVQLFVEDDHTEPKQAVTAFNKLTGVDKVDAVFGGLFDFTAQPLLPLALSQKITFISPINARIPGYFESNDQSFVMLSDFEKIIRNLKPVLEQKKVKRLAVVRFGSEFGKEITRVLKASVEETGGQLVLDEEYGQIGGNDFRTVILKVKNAKPDAVFIDMLSSDAVAFLQRAKENSFAPLVMTHEDIIDALSNSSTDKKLLEGVVILQWGASSPEFNKLYKDKFGADSVKSADKSYDAVYLLAEAIANSPDQASVAAYIEDNEFETVNGKIKFTKDHAAESSLVRVEVIKNGQLTSWVE